MTELLHFIIKISFEIFSGNFVLMHINRKINEGLNNNIQDERLEI